MPSRAPLSIDPAPKLLGLQMLRAVAAFLVVLFHLATAAHDRWSHTAGQATWLVYFEAIGFAGVDLFFVISGVVMLATCYRRFGQSKGVVPFLWRRFTRIYPLYWVCTLAVLGLSALAPTLAVRNKTNPEHIFKSLVLWPERDFPIVGVGWTLSYEMFFYIVFAALLVLPRRLVPVALVVWCGLVLAVFPLFDRPEYGSIRGNLMLPLYASPLVLEFIAGCAIGWLVMRDRIRFEGAALALGIVWFAGIGGYVGANYFDDAAYGLVRVATFGTPSALIVYGVVGLELNRRLPMSRALVFWGDASYSLYLTHVYVLMAFGLMVDRMPTIHQGLGKWLALAACLGACAATAAACHLVIERPLMASFRGTTAFIRKSPVGGVSDADDALKLSAVSASETPPTT